MRTICSRESFRKKCRQQQNFDSDPKEAWHYNHVIFTPIAKNFMLYCRLIYMLSSLVPGRSRLGQSGLYRELWRHRDRLRADNGVRENAQGLGYMLSMLYVRLTIKVKVGIPESFKVGWYPHKITGSSHLKWHWMDFSWMSFLYLLVLEKVWK